MVDIGGDRIETFCNLIRNAQLLGGGDCVSVTNVLFTAAHHDFHGGADKQIAVDECNGIIGYINILVECNRYNNARQVIIFLMHFGNLAHLEAFYKDGIGNLKTFNVGEYGEDEVASFSEITSFQEVETKNEDNYCDSSKRTDFRFVGYLHEAGFLCNRLLKKDKIVHKKPYRQIGH